MLKFEFRKEKLIHSPEIFLFKEFTDIMKWDRSSSQLKSNRMFLYIYYMCDLSEDNPVRESAEGKKHEDAIFRAFGGKSRIKLTRVDKDRLIAGMRCYIRYNETAEERLLKTFDSKAAELRKELDNVKPETHSNFFDGVVSFVSNSKIVSDGLAGLSGIKNKREIIVAAIRREALSTRIRGKMKLSPLSKGDITLFRDVDAVEHHGNLKGKDEAETIQRESLDRIDRIKADQSKKLREATK